MPQKSRLLVIIVLGVALIAFFYWFFVYQSGPAVIVPSPITHKAALAPQAPAGQSLGEKIYEQSANPIQDKVPTVNPVTNPIEGAYKNPFQ